MPDKDVNTIKDLIFYGVLIQDRELPNNVVEHFYKLNLNRVLIPRITQAANSEDFIIAFLVKRY
jgi:hypothetical protein